MVAVTELLTRLRSAGGRVWLRDDRIMADLPQGLRTSALDTYVQRYRNEIVAVLEAEVRAEVRRWPPDEREAFAERSAIHEFDGGLRRGRAEHDAAVALRQSFSPALMAAIEHPYTALLVDVLDAQVTTVRPSREGAPELVPPRTSRERREGHSAADAKPTTGTPARAEGAP